MSKARRLYERIRKEEQELENKKKYISSLFSSLTFKRYVEFRKQDLENDLNEFIQKYPQVSFEIYQLPRYVNTWLISINYKDEFTDEMYDHLDLIYNKNTDYDIFLFTHNHELF